MVNQNSSNIIAKVIIGIIVASLVGLTILIVFGYIYKPKIGAVYIDINGGLGKKMCQNQQVKCQSDSDCSTICGDAIEMSCQTITRNNQDEEEKYGKSGNYCLPSMPSKPCNADNGGIWVWTGWASTDRMEWDCLCTYPNYFGNEGCTRLNPGVCNNGTFNYDATKGQPPLAKDCQCNQNYTLMASNEGDVPFCITNDIFYQYYSDSTKV